MWPKCDKCGKYHTETKTCDEIEDMVEGLTMIVELTKSGYAGTLPNGNIVDRREHPEAYPMAENPMLGIAKPKDV